MLNNYSHTILGKMKKMIELFKQNQPGVQRLMTLLMEKIQVDKLNDIANNVKQVDPLFHSYFLSIHADNVFFCFRWFLLYFKREFTPLQVFFLPMLSYSTSLCHFLHFTAV